MVLTPVPACQECVICSFFKYIIKNGGGAGGLAGEKWRKKAKKKNQPFSGKLAIMPRDDSDCCSMIPTLQSEKQICLLLRVTNLF